jgi:hypothetical protein
VCIVVVIVVVFIKIEKEICIKRGRNVLMKEGGRTQKRKKKEERSK